MKKLVIALVISAFTFPLLAKENKLTSTFVDELKKSVDSNEPISLSIALSCIAPSASGRLIVTKPSYTIGESVGTYLFESGSPKSADLSWLTFEHPNDDWDSKEVSGVNFGLTMPAGQFFITIMKSGKVKAGVSSNAKSGIHEVDCVASEAK
ncbi:hypothetical protein [Enterobacter kobei]|uniref:Uncharacterized protein n=1 Tax=Enterobacter kobei TaxID=208224 RepID=A0AA86M8U4_9ENTR|nr:hypothetical protein [Enterobacter kobei]BCU55302.1 hypothetical protein ENKO_18960 [Enterobacter kobei]SIQ90184.1 hypothetical protein SAMN05444841_102415 [Enterobacter kobei]